MVMQPYEVPLVLQPPNPEQLHPISPLLQEREAQPAGQRIRHCVELPGLARGWVQEVCPMHHTMVASMPLAGDRVCQQGAVEGHGRATCEETGLSEQGEPCPSSRRHGNS